MPDPQPVPDTASPRFDAFIRRRQRLSFTLAAIVLAFFLPLPVLGGFSSLLDRDLGRGLTVAWIYALAQFLLALIVARIYMRSALRLEREGARLIEEEEA